MGISDVLSLVVVLAAVAAGRILAGILVAVLTVLAVIHVFVIVLHGSTS